jgi:thiosulfate/3-mercaptopyruvate sulfurtransferase
MNQKTSPIIHPNKLVQLKKFILIDVRTGANAQAIYEKAHLKGALWVDLEQQLATKTDNAAHGGRHPLPSIEKFSEVLTQLGITPESWVIVYDDKNGSNAAARFWWMLKAVGHSKVQVIDGGMDAAIKAGFSISDKNEIPQMQTPYKADEWVLPMKDLAAVEHATHDDNFLIIDVRSKERFDGLVEPIDLIAGHIPNATNIPFTDNLDADGFFLPPSVLKAKYEAAFNKKSSENVIVHCGSGVTACHTLLALDYAGIEIPSLYVGSWGEWSRNDLPMVTLISNSAYDLN